VFVVANCKNLPRSVTVALPVEEWDLPAGEDWVLSELLSGEILTYQTEDLDSLQVELEPHQIMITVVADSIVVGADESPVLPGHITVDEPNPNPSEGLIHLAFTLPEPDTVEIDLYDLGGRMRGCILPKMQFDAGDHTVEWRNDDLSSGIYFMVFRANSLMKTHRLILLQR
jgi:hypothetical protein